MEIAKFSSKADDNFRRVAGHISRLVHTFNAAKEAKELETK